MIASTDKTPEWGSPAASFIWYNFRPGASILTLLGNVKYTAEKYDYIICFNPERPDVGFLESLAESLAPDGRLLFALDNRYGLKYWCGARDSETGQPFRALEYSSTMLSGIQLRRELQKAGFISQKWYYPLPDHHYPKAVYSENKLPNSFFAAISPMQLTDGAGVLLRESELMPGVIENGMFTFMCNSFIVEASLEPNAVMCPVDFAALTLYRPPYRAFVTMVCADGTAKKMAVHPEGKNSLRTLIENHARLIKRGIETIPMTLNGNSAEMPAVPYETLWDYMQMRVRGGCFDRGEFVQIFDRLRSDILKSSEQSPPGSHGWDPKFGPVLDYAYTEMIPANCFYDAAQDLFIYFDQEHVLQKTPYSVPLSRALMSITYSQELSSHPEMMAFLPELIERYGLTACWDKLVEIERNFIAGLIYGTEAAQEYNRAVSKANAEISLNRHAHNALTAATILRRENKRVGLYGYGRRGKRFAATLEMLDFPPTFIADAKTGGLPKDVEADILVVTPLNGADELAEKLREEIDIPVITLDALMSEY